MKKQDIEYRVLEILERLAKGQPIEDDTVELKAEWPKDHFRAARRIAAHANGARGASILWLIGVDEKKGAVGADFEELSVWFAKVRSRFDQLLVPNLISIGVPFDGMTVVALLFETDRAPFVVRIPDGNGLASHEVPWREANSTRSARRSDLIKLLYPIKKKPHVEVLNGKIEFQKSIGRVGGKEGYQWSLSLKLYFTTFSSETVIIPFHRCRIIFRPAGRPDEKYFDNITLTPPKHYSARGLKETSKSLTISSTEHEAIINTAGMMFLRGEIFSEENALGRLYEELQIKVLLRTHNIDEPIIFSNFFKINENFKKTNDSERQLGQWLLKSEDTEY